MRKMPGGVAVQSDRLPIRAARDPGQDRAPRQARNAKFRKAPRDQELCSPGGHLEAACDPWPEP
jgi:hypothetical protein